MENIEPQYIINEMGKTPGVFLPIDVWNTITEELQTDLRQWQKDLIYKRLVQYKINLRMF